ncbi:sigma-70 family RNA polymerase sigma factor [Anaerohalosphaera lusitana]|nr:sigma-70 family RNA polymerase sigma factor [Anaerohalosphaera lusitana]
MYNENSSNSNRNAEVFLRLLMANRRAIYSFVLSLVGSWSDADDVMQDTVTVMWRKYADFEEGTNFRAWAMQIARFKVFEHQRSKKERTGFDVEILKDLSSQSLRNSEDLDHRIEILQECLDKLAKKDRRLLKLRYEQDFSIKEVAKQTRRPFYGLYKAMARIHTSLLLCVRRGLRLEGVEV